MDGQVEFTLPDSDIYRNLFIITKEKSTPAKYPRKAGLPSKGTFVIKRRESNVKDCVKIYFLLIKVLHNIIIPI